MIINGTNFIPGYINHEGEITQDVNEHHSAIITHRHQTRQRHLSSGADDDIASSYFAAQYGNKPQKQPTNTGKQGSKSNSRRNSMAASSSNANVNQVMANAAALIAAKKQKEREDALKREAEHKRQLQQREMTPDNLRVVEQKLIEFQKQQMAQEQVDATQNINVDNSCDFQEKTDHNQSQFSMQETNHHVQYSQQQIMTEQHQQQMQIENQVMTQKQQQTFVVQQQQTQEMRQSHEVYAASHQQYEHNTQIHQQHQQQLSSEQHSQIMQHQQVYNQQSTYSQQEQYENNNINGKYKNGYSKESSAPPIPQIQQNNITDSGRDSMSREVRAGSEMTYMSLLPSDGSMPHRTNPIGDVVSKRSQSVAATPDREIKRKWSITSSTDYLNKTNKGSYMCRNNPIGLAEPSVKRDGYAVGSREGSMYRSTGNVNVSSGTVGSRAASEARDIPKWQGRRASTSDIKGSGIRVGGNLVEPSAKPQPNMCMPFGSSNMTGSYVKRRVTKSTQQSTQENSSAQQITENKLKAKRERNRTISGETSQTSAKTLTQQVGYALSGITTALEQIQVNEIKQNVTMPLPRKSRRAQSLPRGQVSNEESSFKVSLPGSARTSRQASVEPDHNRKKLSRHGSVEIFDGAYNLTVPNKLSRHSSTTKLEEVHTDHIKITGECENEVSSSKSENSKASNEVNVVNNSITSDTPTVSALSIQPTKEVTAQTESSTVKSSSSIQQSTCTQQLSTIQQSSSVQEASTFQQSTAYKHESSIQKSLQESSVNSFEQRSNQVCSNVQRSRHVSGSNDAVISGNKFNITNGLKRQSHHASQEEVRKSRHVSGTVEHGVGVALKGLDTTLEQIAAQQKRDETQYVAKVTSKQTSRRGSISVSTDSNDVTNVMVSLPASKNPSRTTSRRNSVDLSAAGRGRRGSLDIYTAEYAVKIGNKKNITNVEQKNTFHMKLEADNPMAACESCNYEGHTQDVHDTDEFARRRACVETYGWEPFKEWFYDQSFRTWWQVMGGVGVPLYKIYQRKTEWKTEKPEPSKSDEDRHIARDDSVDDMIAQVLKQRPTRRIVPAEDNDSSGRSTPAHLKDININLPSDEEEEDAAPKKPSKKNRTFSETLKMLDDDILADLDVK